MSIRHIDLPARAKNGGFEGAEIALGSRCLAGKALGIGQARGRRDRLFAHTTQTAETAPVVKGLLPAQVTVACLFAVNLVIANGWLCGAGLIERDELPAAAALWGRCLRDISQTLASACDLWVLVVQLICGQMCNLPWLALGVRAPGAKVVLAVKCLQLQVGIHGVGLPDAMIYGDIVRLHGGSACAASYLFMAQPFAIQLGAGAGRAVQHPATQAQCQQCTMHAESPCRWCTSIAGQRLACGMDEKTATCFRPRSRRGTMAAMSIHTEDFSEGFDAAPARKPRAKAKPAVADVAESSMRSPTISPAPVNKHEEALERALRPKLLDEYVGQAKAREQLEIFIGAAKKRGEALDHVLLFGPPGLGKTTLSHIIAAELGVNLRQTSGPVLEKPKDLAALLTNLEANDVLFIDEIHRLSPVVEEILYPALEDFQIDIMIGEGPAARSIKLDLQPFTLVGATTRAGMLTNPLRDRFGIVARLEFYNAEELARIVTRSAGLLGAPIDAEGAQEIANRSRGTPRIANRLLRRVRDYAEVKGNGTITREMAQKALSMLDVDPRGFDVMDRKLLEAVVHRFDGGPVGVDNIAASIGEDAGTIEDVIEPYLIQQGYLQRTPRGRIATKAAYQHLGLVVPQSAGSLFNE